MSLYIKGKHNILTNKTNIDIYGRISDEIKNQLGSFGNVSIYDLLNTQQKKINTPLQLPSEIIEKIPLLYNQTEDEKTNTFRVCIFGDINSLSAINSFEWIIPYIEETKEEYLPDFSDMPVKNL